MSLVKISPIVRPSSLKASPVREVTCAFTDTLDGFELEEAAVSACRGCKMQPVWVTVQCFHQGTAECSCHDPTWELCEPCCEELLHDKCLTKQTSRIDMNGGALPKPSGTTPSTEVSAESGISLEKLGDDGVTEYMERERSLGLNKNAAEFIPTPEPVAPLDYEGMDYHEPNEWVDGEYMWEPAVPLVPHASEVAWMGVDMKNICIQFAATGFCPRGDSCRWVHCYV
jgi:hypothetical protein